MSIIQIEQKMLFYTIRTKKQKEIKIKKSRFIATIFPISSMDDAKKEIDTTKIMFRNATHYPYALRIGYERIKERFSDDGEPPRSSGLPILQELKKANLTNIIVIVTRYFGGTKLGIGGLSRAYRKSTVNVIMEAHKIPFIPTQHFKLSFQQEIAGKIRNLLHRFNAQIVEETCGESTTYIIEIEKDTYEPCTEAINNLTKGKATIRPIQLIEED